MITSIFSASICIPVQIHDTTFNESSPRWALQGDKQGVRSMAPVLCSSHEQGTDVTPTAHLVGNVTPFDFCKRKRGHVSVTGKKTLRR